jgi:hypothetical protein
VYGISGTKRAPHLPKIRSAHIQYIQHIDSVEVLVPVTEVSREGGGVGGGRRGGNW